ncbi:MAG: gliding motility-associated ABC transporter ATP-binding subunit GldA [Marinilabiliaceae bacterium]|nr:gliding motility-associated ABC transporter ATP-binding subunit GldA [Marinilabiliaceae bacterium]
MSIQVKQVTKTYGIQKALNEVSFNIPSGEVVGFLGPNGAGKSTMMKIITGYLPPSAGEVEVCGMNIADNTLDIRRKIGYLPEHNPLYSDMYVSEYLSMVAGIYHLPKPDARIREMIGLTGLTPEKHKKIGALSKGYRQRVGLAQALLPDPEVLILDEPTTGLDPNQIVDVRELIRNIGREKTVMLSTHIMQEVQAICQRVIIINKGEIVADNRSEQLSASTFQNEEIINVEFDAPICTESLSLQSGITGISQHGAAHYKITAPGDGNDIRPVIFKWAVENQRVILEMNRERHSLEEVFHALTRSGS